MTVDKPTDCPACYGSGFDLYMQPVRFGEKLNPVPCKESSGTGQRQPQPAPSAPCPQAGRTKSRRARSAASYEEHALVADFAEAPRSHRGSDRRASSRPRCPRGAPVLGRGDYSHRFPACL
jgi:hypothetical protein